MGSYANCWLDNLFIGTTKNSIDGDLISMFSSQDKVILSPPMRNLPRQLQDHQDLVSDDPDRRLVYYDACVEVVRDRLDVLGYDRDTAESAFNQWIKARIDANTESLQTCLRRDSPEILAEYYRMELEVLGHLTAGSWMDELQNINSRKLKTKSQQPDGTRLTFMLSHDWYGFTGNDLLVPLRLAMESLDHSSRLIYDLSELVWAGYYHCEDSFVEFGRNDKADEYSATAKIIVLTEGRTDTWILRESLRILYPHLVDYYSFLDFDTTGYGGGVGNLLNAIKVLSGTGIPNNIVAVIDNDTAARVASRMLRDSLLPSNIAVVRLPELAFLSDYPTLGPHGLIPFNINGVAASIELYLGEDVLRIDGNDLVPVQWKGYDRSVGQYQGEVLNKQDLHQRFQDKIERHTGIPGPEWDALRSVWGVIFRAFRDKNRRSIVKGVNDWYTH